MGAVLEKLVPDDWEQVRALRIRAVTENPRAFGRTPEEEAEISEQEWRDRLERGNYLFVKEGKKLVGMGSFIPKEGSKVSHVADIKGIYVCAEVRGRGIGRSLMVRLIEDIKQRFPRILKVKLNVSATQQEAYALYKSLGFREIGIMEKELKVGDEFIDEYQMEKIIRTV